jgi:hypothetical protein
MAKSLDEAIESVYRDSAKAVPYRKAHAEPDKQVRGRGAR